MDHPNSGLNQIGEIEHSDICFSMTKYFSENSCCCVSRRCAQTGLEYFRGGSPATPDFSRNAPVNFPSYRHRLQTLQIAEPRYGNPGFSPEARELDWRRDDHPGVEVTALHLLGLLSDDWTRGGEGRSGPTTLAMLVRRRILGNYITDPVRRTLGFDNGLKIELGS